MIKKILLQTALLFLFLVVFSKSVWASGSNYVLPYPGFMPGHPLYKVTEVVDRLEEWWSFGSLSKFKYQLSLSDKKLVEAKTLFEYKQYLLGYEALQESGNHFENAVSALKSAEEEKKDIAQKKEILQNAATKHIEVLDLLATQIPERFTWTPEKQDASVLPLKDALDDSRKQRKGVL